MSGLADDEEILLKSAESIIDDEINETLHRKTHAITLQKITKCIRTKDSERFREILQILFCKYENAGWSISLDDDLLILE
jgi:hypothetical protein